MQALNPRIFREYDIRGVVGETLHAHHAEAIARAFAAKAGGGKICVGYDGRISSPALKDAMCRGLVASGVEVLDVGLCPTPMLYYAAATQKANGGIMITGSHNPPTHNGFKFVLKGKAFYGADIQALYPAAGSGTFPEGKGKVTACPVFEPYINVLLKAYNGARPLNVAWDAGNGATGEVMAALCQRLPGKHTPLNARIDGTFPAHHPDPTEPENLEQLIEAVRHGRLDLGIAFDGDGDRIGVVDDEGEILWGDQLLMLYVADVLEKTPGATIIADIKASDAVFEEIARLGGRPLMWKAGHSNIKAKMAEVGSVFAGEITGHIFFADSYYGYDDALYAAVRLLSLLSHSGKKLSQLRKHLPQRVNTPEIRFACDDGRKFPLIEEVKQRLKAARAEFSDVDGVRVKTADGWWLLRASNTQPMLVARAEARDSAGLSRLKEDLRKQLALSNVALP